MYTSLNDMESWLNALDKSTLVSASTTKKLFAPVETKNGDIVKYAYGWDLDKYRSMDMIVHGGSWVGFNTVVAKIPERNIWFVGFSNTDAISSNSALITMADHFLGEKPETA